MKAVILAGGEGTRLKAVTGSTPKPLVPLLGRSMMEHILRLLRRCGFTEVCAALRYHAADFEKAFSDGSSLGLRLCYRVEDEPLGTAGAVKNCEDFYGDEDFLLISGDAACDYDLAALAKEHRARGAAVTVALARESVPLRFGLAVTDAAGDIRGFVEKPDWGRVVSDLVNTGIYVLSPRAMARVPRGVPFDFARDLFPLLLREGERLAGVACEGYWCDVGTPASYYRCCVDALEGRLRLTPGDAFAAQAGVPGNAAPLPDGADAAQGEDAGLECPCRDRALLMGTLSELFLELGADYADGLSLTTPRFEMHIRPLPQRSAVRIAVRAEEAEFARALALSAREVVRRLDL